MKYIITDDQIASIREELRPVVAKEGPFKVDAQEFAWSVMEASTEHAENVLKLLEEVEKVYHDIGS